MIKEFHIVGYRGFPEYHLEGLSRVNVFVGKNNAGKSSLLEALHLHSMRLDAQALQAVALRRGEILLDVESRSPDQFQFDLSHFFNGHRIRNGSMIELRSDKQSLNLKVGAYQGLPQTDFDEDGLFNDHPRRDLLSLTASSGAGDEAHALYEAVVAASGAMMSPRRPYLRGSMSLAGNPFISPDSLDSSSLVSMWNKVLVRNDESKIVEALKILEPSVSSIVFLLPEFVNSRYIQRASLAGIVVGMANGGKRYPLGSMGDGMKRLLAIALALSCSSGGSLFVDEIDSGLHYSVMRDLWRLVINAAIANNVQVFVSTHSLDCLRGLSVLSCEDFKDKSAVSLYSINAKDTEATCYSTKEIDTIITHELEVR